MGTKFSSNREDAFYKKIAVTKERKDSCQGNQICSSDRKWCYPKFEVSVQVTKNDSDLLAPYANREWKLEPIRSLLSIMSMVLEQTYSTVGEDS